MFAFFIALFGGLYLAGRCAYDKSASNKFDSDYRTGQIHKAIIVNRKFEDELVKKIANQQYREEIVNLIKDDLQYIYGDVWKELYAEDWYEPKAYTTALNTRENIILMLMLSKSGLVPSCYQFGGVQISNFEIANTYECLRILQCVESNIKINKDYLNAKMIFVPQVMYASPPIKGDIGTPNYIYPSSGKFCWNFEPLYATARYAIDIRNSILVNACKEQSIGERSLASNPYKDKLTL